MSQKEKTMKTPEVETLAESPIPASPVPAKSAGGSASVLSARRVEKYVSPANHSYLFLIPSLDPDRLTSMIVRVIIYATM